MARLTVNGQSHTVDADPDTPLLWVLRDHIGLTGTKYGCGIAQCGACTVHMDGMAVRSCSVPVSLADGRGTPASTRPWRCSQQPYRGRAATRVLRERRRVPPGFYVRDTA